MTHTLYVAAVVALGGTLGSTFITGCAAPEPIEYDTAKSRAPVTGVWPQWRGPGRDGHIGADAPAWPTSLDEQHLRLVWRAEVGPGYSSPVVTGDAVVVTESTSDGGEIVRAFDRRSGKLRWDTRWEGSMGQPFYAAAFGVSPHIRSTPAWDGTRLYVGGMRDVVVCLDGATGDEVWRLDLAAEYDTPLPTWGLVCSPLLVDDYVYVQGGGGFVKIDKRTGRPAWRVLVDGGGLGKATFSSPVHAMIAGRAMLLVQMRDELHGVDPDTGDVLWSQRVRAAEGQTYLTPVPHGDAVFTSAKGGRSTLWRIARTGDGFAVDTAWENNRVGYLSTPVVIADHAYLHLNAERLACIDMRTGNVKWVSTERFGKYVSLAANGDRILGLDNEGTLYLINADTTKLDIIDRRRVSNDETWAHVTPVARNVYIRELNAIAAYEWATAKVNP